MYFHHIERVIVNSIRKKTSTHYRTIASCGNAVKKICLTKKAWYLPGIFIIVQPYFSKNIPQNIPPKPIKSLFLGSITFFETTALGLGQTEKNIKKPRKGV
jgi:hypothetical protein